MKALDKETRVVHDAVQEVAVFNDWVSLCGLLLSGNPRFVTTNQLHTTCFACIGTQKED